MIGRATTGRLPEDKLGLELEESCALTAISGKPTDKEPATAVAIKSRRETVIHPPRKINATKVPARIPRKPTTLSTSTTPLTPQNSIVILRQRSREPKRATPNEGSL